MGVASLKEHSLVWFGPEIILGTWKCYGWRTGLDHMKLLFVTNCSPEHGWRGSNWSSKLKREGRLGEEVGLKPIFSTSNRINLASLASYWPPLPFSLKIIRAEPDSLGALDNKWWVIVRSLFFNIFANSWSSLVSSWLSVDHQKKD